MEDNLGKRWCGCAEKIIGSDFLLRDGDLAAGFAPIISIFARTYVRTYVRGRTKIVSFHCL